MFAFAFVSDLIPVLDVPVVGGGGTPDGAIVDDAQGDAEIVDDAQGDANILDA